MILHTVWYNNFCNNIFGEYYHHTPEPDPEHMSDENRERSLKLIEYWYQNKWEQLIRTCTQCNSPSPQAIPKDLWPSIEVVPKL
ncbi:glycine-rich domain-containing protein [Chryseobacterium caseinilyticum]|uniref:Uncharacterized protein n=1 Tax=Chryseobacterium caseinilyticum TaxID=2771428 RepID=A0ABR8ZHG0_9FLAO|nr:hypothetical protein [Chryseobacterium caseinilyticum]MBD8084657.1 hypothetical protein [Chryseobacterium caseinilyticum]